LFSPTSFFHEQDDTGREMPHQSATGIKNSSKGYFGKNKHGTEKNEGRNISSIEIQNNKGDSFAHEYKKVRPGRRDQKSSNAMVH